VFYFYDRRLADFWAGCIIAFCCGFCWDICLFRALQPYFHFDVLTLQHPILKINSMISKVSKPVFFLKVQKKQE
jgi:hypothetical protein